MHRSLGFASALHKSSWTLLAAFLALGILSSDAPAARRDPKSQQQHLAKLQGTWRAVQLEIGGKAFDPSMLARKGAGVSLEVTGDRFRFVGLGAEFKGELSVDTSVKPPRIVFIRDDGRRTTSAYRWEAGVLKLVGLGNTQAKTSEEPADVWAFKLEEPLNSK